jgi:hypothetical protein
MEQLREKIAAASAEFAASVMLAIRECSLEDLIGDRYGKSTSLTAATATNGAPRRGRPPGPAKAKSGRLARRSEEDIVEMAGKIVAYVKQAGVPMRAEAVRAALAIDKREWMKPLQYALDKLGLKKQGNKRATEYTVGAVKSAAKPAKKAAPKAKSKPAKAKAKAKAAPKKAKPAKAKAKPAKAKAKSNGAAKSKAPKKSKKKALAALDKHIESNGAASAATSAEA